MQIEKNGVQVKNSNTLYHVASVWKVDKIAYSSKLQDFKINHMKVYKSRGHSSSNKK